MLCSSSTLLHSIQHEGIPQSITTSIPLDPAGVARHIPEEEMPPHVVDGPENNLQHDRE